MSTSNRPPSFFRRFIGGWTAGALGSVSLLVQDLPPALRDRAAGLQRLPTFALKALLLVNPLVMMTLLAAMGAALAHRVGLRSRLAGDRDATFAPGIAVAFGLAVAVVLFVADAATASSFGAAWTRVMAAQQAAPIGPSLLVGLLYGGLTEEVMMRWGVMSLAMWLLHSATQRTPSPSRRAASWRAWAAISAAAALFALGHLPLLAQLVAPTGALIARTLLLNTVGGLAYGWLFWRKGLECAMLAHASTHLALAVIRGVAGQISP